MKIMSTATRVFIVGAKRTPFGAFGGALKGLSATDLGVVSTRAAMEQANISSDRAREIVDQVFFGNVIQSSSDAAYLARHVGLKSGLSMETPALTINRLCGSGFETVIQGAKSIVTGESRTGVVVAGGTENMSMAPLQVSGNDARWGVGLGAGMKLTDALWDGLTDAHAGTPMGITAENLAKQYGITRQECDEYAIRSQQTWASANEGGIFEAEMAPVEVKHRKKGTVTIDTDEHPRPETTLESASKLKPVFIKNDGVVTAANASGICDGAGTILLASEEAVQKYDLRPMARLVSYATTGCDPTIMGIGPVKAIQAALSRADLSLSDMDRIEINEAFAAQFLACAKELGLDMDKTNLHGGAISLGHPLGASGSRIMAHLANEFQQDHGKDNRYHVGAACIGGGQGIAVVMENV